MSLCACVGITLTTLHTSEIFPAPVSWIVPNLYDFGSRWYKKALDPQRALSCGHKESIEVNLGNIQGLGNQGGRQHFNQIHEKQLYVRVLIMKIQFSYRNPLKCKVFLYNFFSNEFYVFDMMYSSLNALLRVRDIFVSEVYLYVLISLWLKGKPHKQVFF